MYNGYTSYAIVYGKGNHMDTVATKETLFAIGYEAYRLLDGGATPEHLQVEQRHYNKFGEKIYTQTLANGVELLAKRT